MATNGLSLPRQIVGKDTIIHIHRPESWRSLSETDAALLDFLAPGSSTSPRMTTLPISTRADLRVFQAACDKTLFCDTVAF